MNVRHEEASDDGEVATESSNPEEIHNFEVPEAFTNQAGEVEENDDVSVLVYDLILEITTYISNMVLESRLKYDYAVFLIRLSFVVILFF